MTLREHVTEWLQGNNAAIAFVLAVHDVVETWDDLVDQDKVVSTEEISRAFHLALVEIPRNSFYQAHFSRLSPIIEASILNWYVSNEFEKSKNYERAWALANAGLSVTVMCAQIIGGTEWAKKVGVEFHSITEPLTEYEAERVNGRVD